MSKNGPYQYCDTCKTEKNHSWIAELTYWCNTCQTKTTVPQTAKSRIKTIEARQTLTHPQFEDDKIKYPIMTDECYPATAAAFDEVQKGMEEGKKSVEEFIDKGGKLEYGTSGEEIKQPTPTIGWGSKLR